MMVLDTMKACASMGPRPGSRGERGQAGREAFPAHASMGPRPGSRGELGGGRVAAYRDAEASMGPRPGSRGEPAARAHLPIKRGKLQWGHGLVAVENRRSRRDRG